MCPLDSFCPESLILYINPVPDTSKPQMFDQSGTAELWTTVGFWLPAHWLTCDSPGRLTCCSSCSSVSAVLKLPHKPNLTSQWAPTLTWTHTQSYTLPPMHDVTVCVCVWCRAGSPNKNNQINLLHTPISSEWPSPFHPSPRSRARERKNILWISGNLSQSHCSVEVSSYLLERIPRAAGNTIAQGAEGWVGSVLSDYRTRGSESSTVPEGVTLWGNCHW